MRLEYGTENDFLRFIDQLQDTDKIALISHTDVDGIVSAYVANKILNAPVLIFADYTDLNEALIQRLRDEKVTKVVFTDLYVGNAEFLKELEQFAHVLIVDHHLSQKDWNSERTIFIKGEEGYCAAYLAYYLFSKVKNLEKIDWLVACASIADYCHIKPAEWLGAVFRKYSDVFEEVGTYVRTNGMIWDLQETLSLALIYFKADTSAVFYQIGDSFGQIGELGSYAQEVKAEIDDLVSRFEKEKQPFPGGYLFEFQPRFGGGSMVGTILSGKDIHTTIITLRPNTEKGIYHISARRQDKTVNMAELLKKLVNGLEGALAGGHVPAAGGHFLMKDLNEFKRRLGVAQ